MIERDSVWHWRDVSPAGHNAVVVVESAPNLVVYRYAGDNAGSGLFSVEPHEFTSWFVPAPTPDPYYEKYLNVYLDHDRVVYVSEHSWDSLEDAQLARTTDTPLGTIGIRYADGKLHAEAFE